MYRNVGLHNVPAIQVVSGCIAITRIFGSVNNSHVQCTFDQSVMLTPLRNVGNSVYLALQVSFGGDNKSRRSLLSGVYARGSKLLHQSALEMCNLSWTPPLLEKDNSKNNPVYNTQV